MQASFYEVYFHRKTLVLRCAATAYRYLDSFAAAWFTASSTFSAARLANRRAGFCWGIIKTATAPAATPKPMVSAKAYPFICIRLLSVVVCAACLL